jgi:HAAS domain-containing protein
LIAEYLERLAGLLAFDPQLSRRVRREVEDHLREAAAADLSGDAREAERRAVAAFGDPRAIAAQFAAVSLAKRARRAGAATVLLTAAVFVAMKARLMWYGLMECPAVDLGAFGEVVVSLDRYAFWLSGLAAIAAWMYIDTRGVPAGFTPEYRAQLRRFWLLVAAVAAALTVSVASDGLLIALRLVRTAWSPELLLPIFSVAVEAACAGVLISHVLGMARRASAADRQVAIAGKRR